jgi:hypothetical protein
MVLGSGIRDPGSGKKPFRILDPGVKKAPDPGSRIRNTEYYIKNHMLAQNSSHQNIPGTKQKIMNIQLRGKENTIA